MSVFWRICLIAFLVGAGYAAVNRLASESLAVLVGVLCGVSASIPVALLVLYAVRQNQRQTALVSQAPPPPPPQQPQVIILGQPLPGWGAPTPNGAPALPSGFTDRSRFAGLGGLVDDENDGPAPFGIG